MVRQPDFGPPSVQQDALGHAVAEGLDGVRHQMQDPGLIVLPGHEHGQHEQAAQGGELFPDGIIAARPDGVAAGPDGRRHGRYLRPPRSLSGAR